jgi:hypothetical protein
MRSTISSSCCQTIFEPTDLPGLANNPAENPITVLRSAGRAEAAGKTWLSVASDGLWLSMLGGWVNNARVIRTTNFAVYEVETIIFICNAYAGKLFWPIA